eukprot:352336-Chlamydomonas_euryale.AAC.6
MLLALDCPAQDLSAGEVWMRADMGMLLSLDCRAQDVGTPSPLQQNVCVCTRVCMQMLGRGHGRCCVRKGLRSRGKNQVHIHPCLGVAHLMTAMQNQNTSHTHPSPSRPHPHTCAVSTSFLDLAPAAKNMSSAPSSPAAAVARHTAAQCTCSSTPATPAVDAMSAAARHAHQPATAPAAGAAHRSAARARPAYPVSASHARAALPIDRSDPPPSSKSDSPASSLSMSGSSSRSRAAAASSADKRRRASTCSSAFLALNSASPLMPFSRNHDSASGSMLPAVRRAPPAASASRAIIFARACAWAWCTCAGKGGVKREGGTLGRVGQGGGNTAAQRHFC